jgi:hypothetical protein
MHDCVKTRELLVDLVFNELGPEAGARALLEIEGCPDCLAQYRSMAEALRVFDQATETAMPGENYWLGYEARLRERLRHERPNWTRPGWTRWMADWIGGFRPLAARPLTLAAGLALVLLVIGLWTWRSRQAVGPFPGAPVAVTETPSPQSKVKSPDGVIAITPKPGEVSQRPTPVHPKDHSEVHPAATKSNDEAPPGRREGQVVQIAEDIVVSRVSEQPFVAASLYTPETIRHFEKAQLMLRSFRNASARKSPAASDLTYEKQSSRRLLYQNILLRRDAEIKGNIPAEEALSDLEPFLLDIANLPDNPSSSELGAIRERLQRKELIASLQIASAQPSASAYRAP